MVDRSDAQEVVIEKVVDPPVDKSMGGLGVAGKGSFAPRDPKPSIAHGSGNSRHSHREKVNHKRDRQNWRNGTDKNLVEEGKNTRGRGRSNRNKVKPVNGENPLEANENKDKGQGKTLRKSANQETEGTVEKKETQETKPHHVKNQKSTKNYVQRNGEAKKKSSSPKPYRNGNTRGQGKERKMNVVEEKKVRGDEEKNQNGEKTGSLAEAAKTTVEDVPTQTQTKSSPKIILPPIDDLSEELNNVTFGGSFQIQEEKSTTEVPQVTSEVDTTVKPIGDNPTLNVVSDNPHQVNYHPYHHVMQYPGYYFPSWDYPIQQHPKRNHGNKYMKRKTPHHHQGTSDYKNQEGHVKNDYDKKNETRNFNDNRHYNENRHYNDTRPNYNENRTYGEEDAHGQMHSQVPLYYGYHPMMMQHPSNQVVPYVYPQFMYPFGNNYNTERNVNSDSNQT